MSYDPPSTDDLLYQIGIHLSEIKTELDGCTDATVPTLASHVERLANATERMACLTERIADALERLASKSEAP